jgi:hypothetical protein
MQSATIKFVSALAVFLACSAECKAGPWGKVIREAVEVVTKKSGKAAREGVEAATKKGASRVGAKAASRGGALLVRGSDDVAARVVGRFGDDGVRALNSLSPTGAKRLAMMSDDLAGSGRGRDWMRIIAQRGDEATDWLWQRRGSVAVGTVATAVLLQPEEFIEASERVATTTINAAGEHIAGPIVNSAASAIPWALVWIIVIGAAALWVLAKKRFAELRRRLFDAGIQALTSVGRQRQTDSRERRGDT